MTAGLVEQDLHRVFEDAVPVLQNHAWFFPKKPRARKQDHRPVIEISRRDSKIAAWSSMIGSRSQNTKRWSRKCPRGSTKWECRSSKTTRASSISWSGIDGAPPKIVLARLRLGDELSQGPNIRSSTQSTPIQFVDPPVVDRFMSVTTSCWPGRTLMGKSTSFQLLNWAAKGAP